MKKVTSVITLVAVGFVFSGIAQESSPPKPIEKKPAAQSGQPAQAGKPKEAAPKPKQAAPKPKPAKKPPAPKKYVIKSGDNPWTIAKDHNVDHAELLELNKIKDPKDLQIGQVLILPEGVASKNEPKQKPAVKPAQVAAKPEAGDGWEFYTIKSGDNPWTISKELNVDHQEILSLNEGLNFRDLKIGQQIKVPKKS